MRVDRLVRACTPAPGAWTTLRDRRVKLGPVTPLDAPPLEPGEVRPEGKGAMPAVDWLRGLRLEPGERFT